MTEQELEPLFKRLAQLSDQLKRSSEQYARSFRFHKDGLVLSMLFAEMRTQSQILESAIDAHAEYVCSLTAKDLIE